MNEVSILAANFGDALPMILSWVVLGLLVWQFVSLFFELVKTRGKLSVSPQLMAALAVVYAALAYGAR